MVTELQRRVTNLSSTIALAALNRAMSWVTRQGSFQFLMAGPVTLVVTQDSSLLASSGAFTLAMDPGKAKMVFNGDGSPVQHVPFSEFWASENYNVASTGGLYDVYTLKTDNSATNSHTMYFLPKTDGNVFLYYHRLPTPLTGDTSIPDLPPDFHILLVDLAEAEERRIYDVGDSWQLLMTRAQDQLKLLMDGYRSMTQQPSSMSDSTLKIQEETQTGRA